MRAPAILIALPLLCGCGSGLLLGDSADPAVGLPAAVAAGLALVAALAALVDGQGESCTAAIAAGALLAGGSLGASAAHASYHPSLLEWFLAAPRSAPVLVHGRLRDDAYLADAGVSLTVDVDRVYVDGVLHAVTGGVRVSVAGTLAPGAIGRWRAGRRVRFSATLRPPAVYRNPGVPDDRRALARRGIALVGSVKSGALVEIVQRGSAVDEAASGFRAWARRALASAIAPWSHRSAGVATAIAIGDRTALSQDDEKRLQEAGTYHVVAISGGNIAILTMILLGALRVVRVPPRVAAAVAILVLVVYGRITGPAPSVDRAVAAAVVFLSGRVLDLRGPSLNVLAVAAILGLAWSPASIADPGFILSFGATVAILIAVPRMAARLQAVQPVRWSALRLDLAIGVLAATVAAEVALAPVSAALFARLTFAGLALNFAAIPLMTIVQVSSLIALAALEVSRDAAYAAGYVTHVAADALIESSRLVDSAPWLVRDVSPPAWAVIGLYYAALAAALSRTRIARAAGGLAAALALSILVSPRAIARDAIGDVPAGWMRVVFFDVGQGDATLVVLPDGRALLVDSGGLPPAPLHDPGGGPGFDIGERVLARALRACGVRRLETLVITHGDPDHIGGARTLMRRFAPRAIWEGVPVPPFEPLHVLMDEAARRGMEWRTVQAGDRVKIAGVDLDVLHPPPPDWERQRVRNDDSIVLALRYRRVTVVLPGDVGREGEQRLLPRIARTPIVVLKAPHHGSATSSTPELLDALAPAAVVFSAGRDNRFNHPHPAVVARYRARGVAVFSTATDGAVILDTDGERVVMRRWIHGWSTEFVVMRADGAGSG
ncbi:MAG TPA: DNA internalization-related competence protein ComEC/Rec2 [Vicinamibacterales bacterium]|nr:DNA internalization-related competence protein ComEC/Rec2 [Vicinamibacterales bacterium]